MNSISYEVLQVCHRLGGLKFQRALINSLTVGQIYKHVVSILNILL